MSGGVFFSRLPLVAQYGCGPFKTVVLRPLEMGL